MHPIPLPLFKTLTPYFKATRPGFFLFGHGVTDKPKANGLIQDLHIELDKFAEMVELWEKMGFVFISMEQAMEVVLEGKKIDRPWIHLTFDDGYKNNYTVLYPYLSSKKIPFTIFLSTRNMVEQRRFDNYKIYCALTHCRDKQARHAVLQPFLEWLPGPGDPDAEILAMVKLFKYFKTHEKEAFLQGIESLLSDAEWRQYNSLYDTEEVLTLEDINTMSKDPLVYFGSHGYNHYILSTLDDDQINFEQRESQKIIEELTGRLPLAYCYPNGRMNEDFPDYIDELCRENNYELSFTTAKEKYIPGVNPYLIPRLPVSYRYMPKLFLKLL